MLAFIYTHCPDVCPLIVAKLHNALLRLGSQAAKVQVVAVSVDPKGDTPETVKAFLAARERRRAKHPESAGRGKHAITLFQGLATDRVEDQFDHFMQTRHGAECRSVLDPAKIESEYAEFRRRRNRWLRRHSQ